MKAWFVILLLLPLVANSAPHKLCNQLRIAVIDTGLNLKDYRFKGHLCETGHKNYVLNETMNDINGHGTFVAGLIQKEAKDSNYCMVIYKYYQRAINDHENLTREVFAIEDAIKEGIKIINFSGGGENFSEEESLIIKSHPEVTFVVAAGNDGKNVDIHGNEFFPASLFYKNLIVVGSTNPDGSRASTSNYGSKIKNVEIGEDVTSYFPDDRTGTMSGTSMATAIFSGKLLAKKSEMCEYR